MLKTLKNITETIFYITNDVTKGLGLEKLLPDYHIVCIDDHPIIDYLAKAGANVFCLEREIGRKNIIFRNSGKLLEHPLVEKYIKNKAGRIAPWILFFKPSAKIDHLCQKYGYKKIGNSAKINQIFEDKISFYQICQQMEIPIPPGEIVDFSKVDLESLENKYGKRLVIQFGRGWAGSTTFFVENREEFKQLKKNIGKKIVKITQFIDGKAVLNNCCVAKDKILVSPPAEQITAVPGFTVKKGGACGRAWPADLGENQVLEIERLTKRVGKEMGRRGYLGYFGLDFLVEKETGKIYLSENNARLTASAPFYSKLEIGAGRMPLLAHHILTFLDKDKKKYCQAVKLFGSEVVMRNDRNKPVLVKGNSKPGIYQFKAGKLKFVRESYDIEGIKNKREFFLTAVANNRIVSPETEIVRMNTFQEVLDENGRPKRWVIEILVQIKESLIN